MTRSRVLIAIVDDDASVRESLRDLLNEIGFAVRIFPSADAFLASVDMADAQCLIADVAMPGKTGFDLQDELRRQGHEIPMIFMTAQTDDVVRRQLTQTDVITSLHKPFSEEALLNAIDAALGHR